MKEKQKQILSEMMQEDEKLGLYDETVYTAAEFYSKVYGKNNDKESFLAGARWQQKQNSDKKYSEDELLNILNEYNYAIINEDRINTIGTVKKWFEQFSKLKNG